MRFGVVVIVCAGCGRLNFDPRVDAVEALGPFSDPIPIAELDSSGNDDDPSLTADLLEIFFMSDQGGGSDKLYTSKRVTATDPWPPPVVINEISTGGNVNNTRVTGDGLAIYFSSSRAPSVMTDIWVSTRPDRNSTWGAPTRIVELAGPLDDFEPWVSDGELAIYYTKRTAAGDSDLTVATRSTKAEPFGAPVTLDTISSPVYDGSPWANATGSMILFHSPRGDVGMSDLYIATRASAAEPFGAPALFESFNTTFNDEDPWLSPDGRTFVFTSDRAGTNDLYIATR